MKFFYPLTQINVAFFLITHKIHFYNLPHMVNLHNAKTLVFLSLLELENPN